MNRIADLLFHSSSMEKLEREHVVRWQITTGFNQEKVEEDFFHVDYYPHKQIINIDKVKVIMEIAVFSLGTSPRYVADENIMFFASEEHRVEFLSRMGFEEEWIKNNLLPQEAEIIPFPLPRISKINFTTKKLAQPRTQNARRAQKYFEVATKNNLGIRHPGGYQRQNPSAGVL